MKYIIGIILAALIFAAGWWLKPCGCGGTVEYQTIYRDTGIHIIDSVPAPYYVSEPIYIFDTITDSIPYTVPFDTAAILADYYRKRDYNDTVVNDTSIMIAIQEQVWQNRISSRVLSYRLKSVKTPVQKEKTSLLIGSYVGTMGAGLQFGAVKKNIGVNILAGTTGYGIGLNYYLPL